MIDPPPVALSLDTDNPAVSIRAVTKRYGAQTALQDLQLTVPTGGVYALVGPNGSGKTTTFRVLLDLVRADSGSASILGHDCVRSGAAARALIGYVPERHDFGDDWMTVLRLFSHLAVYYPQWDPEYARALSGRLELQMDKPLAMLSKGEARRTQLVAALAHRPQILLLDELADGLDPLARDTVLGILVEHLADSETSVLLATHLIHLVDRLVDHVGLLTDGRLRFESSRQDLDQRVRRYRAEVPPDWSGVEALRPALIARRRSDREIVWTVWGDEQDVVRLLTQAGAEVRDTATLTLEETTLALMQMRRRQGQEMR